MSHGKAVSLVEVIPLVRGIPKPSLTYFSTIRPPIGSLVKIPLRSGQATGLVVSAREARDAKSDIRRADFPLRKLAASGTGGFSPAFIRAAEKMARYYATSLGSVLATVVSKPLLDEQRLRLIQRKGTDTGFDSKCPRPTPHTLIMQAETHERYSRYHMLVREAFARRSSILILVPTQEDGRRLFTELSRGIEEYAFCFHGGQAPKQLRNLMRTISRSDHPILLVTTSAGLGIERPDFRTMVIERETSRAYRTMARPYLDTSRFVEFLAAEYGATLVRADIALSVDTLWREEVHERAELLPIRWRLAELPPTSLVDLKSSSGFSILSSEVIAMIERARRENVPVFLFGVRKGLAPTTICQDCGAVLACKECGSPVVLTKRSNERIYVCQACRATRSPATLCDECRSWKLETLGIGVDRIAEELTRHFPDYPPIIFDKDHQPHSSSARALARRLGQGGFSIMVGTELGLSLFEHIPYTAVVSVDALFSIPDFRIEERIFGLLLRIREMATRGCIIQTRNIGARTLGWAAKGNVSEFYKAELTDRRQYLYPPLSVFILVSTEGTMEKLERAGAMLRSRFVAWHPDFLKVRLGLRTELRMILRLDAAAWPEEGLHQELLLLPTEFSIKVDPESLLS